MPIPSSINDLDTNPNNNSPQGSETVGPNANGYLQALSAFIKQLAVGTGLKPTATVDMNGQKVTNIAQGTISTTSKDVVRGDQLYKIGEVRMYHGAAANIASVWGPGWQLADGTNGTANLSDKFVIAAGPSHALNSTGGSSTVTLTTDQLPAHSHTINDAGHSHPIVISDPGHLHGVSDPGHSHGIDVVNAGGLSPAVASSSGGGDTTVGTTRSAATNLSVRSGTTGITASSTVAATGIGATNNTGSGSAVPTVPPYYALCFIEYTGAA